MTEGRRLPGGYTLEQEGYMYILRGPDGTVLAYFDADLFSEAGAEEAAAKIVEEKQAWEGPAAPR